MTTWERRDKRVLEKLADASAIEAGFLSVEPGSEELGLSLTHAELHDSILVLIDAGYVAGSVQYSGGGGALFTHLSVTGRGLQALGEWPWFSEASPATLSALLERIAEQTSSEEEAEDARRAASYVAGLSVDTLAAAVAAAGSTLLRGALGLS